MIAEDHGYMHYNFFENGGVGYEFDPQRKRENILEKETFYDLW